MSQYKIGTVTVTNGSNIVTGSGTLWLANVSVGDWFKIDDIATIYQVSTIDTDTQLKLSVNYGGANGSGLAYCIVRDFTIILGLPLIYRGDIDWPDIYNRCVNLIDGAGSLYLGKLADDPNTAGWGVDQEGYEWYNTTDHNKKMWNGTEIVLIG